MPGKFSQQNPLPRHYSLRSLGYGLVLLIITLHHDNKCLKTMDCLFSLGSTMGAMEQAGLHRKSQPLISHKKPLIIPRYGLHQAKTASKEAKDAHPKGTILKSLPALTHCHIPRSNLKFPILFSASWWNLGCPRV